MLPGPKLSRALAVVAVTAALLAGCSDDSGTASGDSTTRPTSEPARPAYVVPGTNWARVAPAAAGFDPDELDAVAQVADRGKSNCLVVVRDGKLVGEWYFRGTTAATTQDVFSATKSITSVLVGIAQDDGDLDVDDSASKWISEWRGTPAEAVTIRDLLSMDSGREWSLALDYVQFLQALDRTKFAVGLKQQHAPGQVWAYNNAAVQTLQRVLLKATGEPVQTFAQKRLFGPLGMSHTKMAVDAAGNAQMFEGVASNCQDMARLGLLMLDDGRWGGEQLVSSAWVRASTGRSSTKLNVGYGYLWWLNHKGPISGPLVATDIEALKDPKTYRGQLAPGAPEDLFWALGLGNQLVQVDPGTKTVVVRLGQGGPRPQPPTFGPTEASKVVTDAVQP